MNKTHIEWTDFTSNPLRAINKATGKAGHFCEMVSQGCRHCYASSLQMRYGTGLPFIPRNREKVELYLNDKELREWSKPRYRGKRVFAFDMTDLFGEWVSDDWLDKCFAAMALAPEVTFQILTKRPERMREYMGDGEERAISVMEAAATMPDAVEQYCQRYQNYAHEGEPSAYDSDFVPDWPLPNVWLGVTVENQHFAHERIPILLDTPAAVRFLSCEPLLEPIEIDGYMMTWAGDNEDASLIPYARPPIQWVIVGGESGSGHRPFDPDWARSIVAQCRDAGVACFVKQLGGHHPGSKLEDLPEDLRVREFPR